MGAMQVMIMMMKRSTTLNVINSIQQRNLHQNGRPQKPSTLSPLIIAQPLSLKTVVLLKLWYPAADGLLLTRPHLGRTSRSRIKKFSQLFTLSCLLIAIGICGLVDAQETFELGSTSNIGESTMLLFQGSGPGADQGYFIQGYNLASQERFSFQPIQSDISFLRAVNEQKLIAVKGFGNKRQEIVLIDTQSGSVEVLAWTESAALMYPTLSRDQQYIAILILPERRDAPPRKAAIAKLGVFQVPNAEIAPIDRQLTAVDVVAEELPVIPFDWDSTSRSLYYTVALPEIVHVNIDTRETSPIRQGLFPQLSTDGSLLALIDGHNVVVADSRDPSKVVISHTLEGHPGWLAWKPDEQVLAFTEELPAWRVRIGLISIADKSRSTIVDTARAKNLTWLKSEPNWQQYDGD